MSHNAAKQLSIFLVASHAEPVFRRCLESVISHLPLCSEIVIVFNGPQPEKEKWLRSLGHPDLVLIRSKKTCVSQLRNLAFTECSGEIIYFLDDDVIVPNGLFESVLKRFQKEPALSIIGGPNLTPPDSTFQQKIFGAILTSPFAAPFVYSRYTRRKDKKEATGLDLILCNLAMRRSHVPKSLRFYEGLYPNEETLFLHRAKRKKLHLSYSEDLFVYHHRRGTMGKFLQQIRGYGFGRGKQTLLDPLSLPFVFVLPAAFVSLTLFFLFSPLHMGVAYAFLSLTGWLSSKECRSLGFLAFGLAPLLTLAVHFSYLQGLGKAFAQAIYRPTFESLSHTMERAAPTA